MNVFLIPPLSGSDVVGAASSCAFNSEHSKGGLLLWNLVTSIIIERRRTRQRVQWQSTCISEDIAVDLADTEDVCDGV